MLENLETPSESCLHYAAGQLLYPQLLFKVFHHLTNHYTSRRTLYQHARSVNMHIYAHKQLTTQKNKDLGIAITLVLLCQGYSLI